MLSDYLQTGGGVYAYDDYFFSLKILTVRMKDAKVVTANKSNSIQENKFSIWPP